MIILNKMSFPTLASGTVEIVEVEKVQRIKYVQVNVSRVILNYGAFCYVVLLDQAQQVIERLDIEITGDDYNRWIADDDIIDLVLEKLSFTKKPQVLNS